MNVIIVATKACRHRPILERQLKDIGVSYVVEFVEDNPELVARYDIHQSPNLVVEGRIVFRAGKGRSLPTQAVLKQLASSA